MSQHETAPSDHRFHHVTDTRSHARARHNMTWSYYHHTISSMTAHRLHALPNVKANNASQLLHVKDITLVENHHQLVKAYRAVLCHGKKC